LAKDGFNYSSVCLEDLEELAKIRALDYALAKMETGFGSLGANWFGQHLGIRGRLLSYLVNS
jgi:hypothetical protein